MFHSTCRTASVALSYGSAKSNHTLDGSTIRDAFIRQVEATPDREMVVFSRDNIRLTFEQFFEKVSILEFRPKRKNQIILSSI